MTVTCQYRIENWLSLPACLPRRYRAFFLGSYEKTFRPMMRAPLTFYPSKRLLTLRIDYFAKPKFSQAANENRFFRS